MCCVLEPAVLSSTILLAHQVEHNGKLVNVLGYQNTAESKRPGPNAMIIPLPSAVPMSQENCIDMTGVGDVFHEYEKLLRPRSRGLSKGGVAVAGSLTNDLQVFDSGSYTVLLTKQTNLTALRLAMKELPPEKRLELSLSQAKIFSAYRKLYPEWHIAICIWDGYVAAEPILWWYEPISSFVDRHFLPGLDAHDGNPPDPSLKSVPIDHTIVVGAPGTRQEDNATEIVTKAPEHLRKWLPTNVFGALLHHQQARNGDWVLPKKGWDHSNMGARIRKPRIAPPGYAE